MSTASLAAAVPGPRVWRRSTAAVGSQAQGHEWGPWQRVAGACIPDHEDVLVRICDTCGGDDVIAASCASEAAWGSAS